MTTGGDPFHFIRVRSVLAVIALCALALLVPYRLVEALIGDVWAPISVEIGIYLSILLVLGWLCHRTGVDLRRLLGPSPDTRSALRTAALALPLLAFSFGTVYALYLPLSFLAPGFVQAFVLEPLPVLVRVEGALPIAPNLLVLVSLCLLAPACEEFVFRGLFLHRWATRWDLPKAVLATSLFFGAFHADLVGATVFGVVASILYLETRSLWAPLILHAANNLIAYGMTLAEVAMYGSEQHYDLATFRAQWWIGAIGLALGGPFTWRFLRRRWRPEAWPDLPRVSRTSS